MIVFTVDEIQDEGLALVGLNLAPQERGGIKRNARRFMENFGSSPAVCAVILHDLQSTNIPAARITACGTPLEVRRNELSLIHQHLRVIWNGIPDRNTTPHLPRSSTSKVHCKYESKS
jgi:hypothetical protein